MGNHSSPQGMYCSHPCNTGFRAHIIILHKKKPFHVDNKSSREKNEGMRMHIISLQTRERIG